MSVGGAAAGMPAAVAQIVDSGDRVVGAGFLVADGMLVTCAHVVVNAGSGPGERLRVVFPHAVEASSMVGHVLADLWRDPEGEDVSFVRLEGSPVGTQPLVLGSASGRRRHGVRSFGFARQGEPTGYYAYAEAGDVLPGAAGTGLKLQLTDANTVTLGFSGAPVLDDVVGLVIGMVTSITDADDRVRGLFDAFATPTEVLREVWPDLVVRDVEPYRGLEAFTTDDARWFHGRAAAVTPVLDALREQRRVLLLLGPSGAGKSSLVQAGVLPRLAAGEVPGSDRWLPVLVRPREDLLVELDHTGLPASADGIEGSVGLRLAGEQDYDRLLLVIDAFEEALQPGSERMASALDQITAAVSSPTALMLILVMRDDFYPQLAALAPELLQTATVVNVPAVLTTDDLRAIIAAPAKDAGGYFEDGLVDTIISDALATVPWPRSARQAPVTVLPPLELALTQLWQDRAEARMTHASYQRIGKISGSVAAWGAAAMRDVPEQGEPIARRILTALVRPADDARNISAVRQQLPLQTLRELAVDPETAADRPSGTVTFDEVLTVLTRHRIVVTGTVNKIPVAELVHDALIRDWADLREWVEQDRQFQDWLRRADEQHPLWAKHNATADLLHGSLLVEGLDWSSRRSLPRPIADFLAASHYEQRAAIRRARRLNAILAAILAVAVTAAGVAFWQRQSAIDAQREEVAQRREAVAQQRIAVGRGLQVQAESVRLTDPRRSLQLGLAAHTINPSADTASSLGTTLNETRLAGIMPGLAAAAVSPDGRMVAEVVGDDAERSVVLWDVASRTRPVRVATLTVAGKNMVSAAFNSDGSRLATGLYDHRAVLWDIGKPDKPRQLATMPGVAEEGDPGMIDRLAFSPDDKMLAFANINGLVVLWNIASGRPVRLATLPDSERLADGRGGAAMAFGRDGRTLFTSRADSGITAWTLSQSARPRVHSRRATAGAVTAMAISPDGNLLVTSTDDNSTTIWGLDDAGTPSVSAVLTGHTKIVGSIAFSDDGQTLVTGAQDETTMLWDMSRPARPLRIMSLTGNDGPVRSLAFSHDGRTLTAISAQVVFWTVRDSQPVGRVNLGAIGNQVLSDDGRHIAGLLPSSHPAMHVNAVWNLHDLRHPTRSSVEATMVLTGISGSGTLLAARDSASVHLWDVAKPGKGMKLAAIPIGPKHGSDGPITVFGPDDRMIAIGAGDQLTVWDLRDPSSPKKIRTHAPVRSGEMAAAAVSPDGAWFAIDAWDIGIQLWPIAQAGNQPVVIPPVDEEGLVRDIAFSADGHKLVAGTSGGVVAVWDLKPGQPQLAARLTGTFQEAQSVAFSRDGQTVAAGTNDGYAILWNIAPPSHPTQIARLAPYGLTDEGVVQINGVGFGTDGHTITTLAQGSEDTQAIIWDITQPLARFTDPIAEACSALDQGLTEPDWNAFISGIPFVQTCPP